VLAALIGSVVRQSVTLIKISDDDQWVYVGSSSQFVWSVNLA
jgi:hypothetical protein